jgi:hypothetical protein
MDITPNTNTIALKQEVTIKCHILAPLTNSRVFKYSGNGSPDVTLLLRIKVICRTIGKRHRHSQVKPTSKGNATDLLIDHLNIEVYDLTEQALLVRNVEVREDLMVGWLDEKFTSCEMDVGRVRVPLYTCQVVDDEMLVQILPFVREDCGRMDTGNDFESMNKSRWED